MGRIVEGKEASMSKTIALIIADIKKGPAMTSDEQITFLMKRFQRFMKKNLKQKSTQRQQKLRKVLTLLEFR